MHIFERVAQRLSNTFYFVVMDLLFGDTWHHSIYRAILLFLAVFDVVAGTGHRKDRKETFLASK
jgi:hypothetical protein